MARVPRADAGAVGSAVRSRMPRVPRSATGPTTSTTSTRTRPTVPVRRALGLEGGPQSHLDPDADPDPDRHPHRPRPLSSSWPSPWPYCQKVPLGAGATGCRQICTPLQCVEPGQTLQ